MPQKKARRKKKSRNNKNNDTYDNNRYLTPISQRQNEKLNKRRLLVNDIIVVGGFGVFVRFLSRFFLLARREQ